MNLILASFTSFYILLSFTLVNYEASFILAFTSVSMLFMSFVQLISGFMEFNIRSIYRKINVITGAIVVALSITTLFKPVLTDAWITRIFGFGLVTLGSVRFLFSILIKKYVRFYRIASLFAGLICVTIGLIIAIIHGIPLRTQLNIVSLGFLALVILRFLFGYSGRDVYVDGESKNEKDDK